MPRWQECRNGWSNIWPPIHHGKRQPPRIDCRIAELFGLGTVGYLVRTSSGEGDESAQIRDLEAQYMSLYSAETLVDVDSGRPVLNVVDPHDAGSGATAQ
jgi:hypothetical protein